MPIPGLKCSVVLVFGKKARGKNYIPVWLMVQGAFYRLGMFLCFSGLLSGNARLKQAFGPGDKFWEETRHYFRLKCWFGHAGA
jgi:hypothetical protein